MPQLVFLDLSFVQTYTSLRQEMGHPNNLHSNNVLTLKKFCVEPESSVPYWISVCLARSSADSIGVNILSTVRKAARLAVYDEMMMSVKNHHTLPTTLPDIDLKSKIRQIPIVRLNCTDVTRRTLWLIDMYAMFPTFVSLWNYFISNFVLLRNF